MTCLARLADDDEHLAGKFFGYSRCLAPRFEIAGFELSPLTFEAGFICLRRAQGFAAPGSKKLRA